MYRYILFDLDGTITDSREGITKSAQYALEKFGIYEPNLKVFEKFIGPPLRASFLKYYGNVINESNVEEAMKHYRSRYQPIGMFENEVYEGIPELLSSLKEKGCKLAVASSKPEVYVKQILDHFQLSSYFDVVKGSRLDGSLEDKFELITNALEELVDGTPISDNVVMIGDRKYDVEGAVKKGVDSIGVRYGFSTGDELEQAGATYIAETVKELGLILQLS